MVSIESGILLQHREALLAVLDAQHREVGARILEHDIDRELALVGEQYLHLIGAIDDLPEKERLAIVLRDVEGVTDEDARWRPDDKLIALVGIVNHLTHVEWRWIDGAMLGVETSRSEAEFTPGPELTVDSALRTTTRFAV